MTEYIDQLGGLVGIPAWVLQAFLIILAALLLEFVYRSFIGRLEKYAEKTRHHWDNAIVYAGKRPISLLIWWQGLVMAARVMTPHTDFVYFSSDFLNALQQLGLVLAATWLFFRLTTGFEQAYVAERRKRNLDFDITTVSVLGRIVRIAVILTGVLTVLSILEIPISGFWRPAVSAALPWAWPHATCWPISSAVSWCSWIGRFRSGTGCVRRTRISKAWSKRLAGA